MTDWPSIVGPELAAVSTPRRLSAGTLTLGCSGPVAMELQHLATMLLERVNLHLGRAVAQRLRIVQEARAPANISAPVESSEPRPVAIPDFPPGPLRDALARLGSRVVTEGA